MPDHQCVKLSAGATRDAGVSDVGISEADRNEQHMQVTSIQLCGESKMWSQISFMEERRITAFSVDMRRVDSEGMEEFNK